MSNTLARLGIQVIVDIEEERAYEEVSQCSYFLNFSDIDKLILGDENSITISHASNRSVNIQRSIEGRVLLKALAQYTSPYLQSSDKSNSKKGTSR
jgi:hypothetical protein